MVQQRHLPPAVGEVLANIRDVVPLLARYGARGEMERRIPDEPFDALVKTGAFRTSVPRRFGGLAGNSHASIAVAREISRGDGGAGWVFSILNSGAWVVSLMTPKAQEDVWSASPDQLISIVLPASSKAVRVDGGYRVTGRWSYGTGRVTRTGRSSACRSRTWTGTSSTAGWR